MKEIDIIHNGEHQIIAKAKTEDILALLQAKCLRCGYTWYIRTPHPRRCPECKSPYWNKPRKAEAKE